jgi:hypothetical protein
LTKNPKGHYDDCADRLDKMVAALAVHAEAPRFAFPPPEIALIAGVDQIGHRLARNETAHALVEAVKLRFTIAEMPTVLMLRAILRLREIPFDVVSLAELGLTHGQPS